MVVDDFFQIHTPYIGWPLVPGNWSTPRNMNRPLPCFRHINLIHRETPHRTFNITRKILIFTQKPTYSSRSELTWKRVSVRVFSPCDLLSW